MAKCDVERVDIQLRMYFSNTLHMRHLYVTCKMFDFFDMYFDKPRVSRTVSSVTPVYWRTCVLRRILILHTLNVYVKFWRLTLAV